MSPTDLTDLAWDLASDGFVGREAAVLQVVLAARATGLSSTLSGVLADVDQPEVARMRAFGRLAALLDTVGTAAPATATRAA